MKWIILLSFYAIFLSSCQNIPQDLLPFKSLSSQHTGIDFRNDLIESPESNILEYLYFYNGSGVAIEDINNDGLPDIYFGSNQQEDKLYLNQGNFKFKDVSSILPSKDLKGWTNGINMVDINADGWIDIYVSRLSLSPGQSNKLFINQKGNRFIEQSKIWGLDKNGYCTQSSFFDYDNDGDLDCYILKHSEKDPDQFKKSAIRKIKDDKAGDLLLENTGTQFIDMTKESNIYSSSIGFGLGVSTADLNNDGWMDIYVCNDFHEQDYMYINNHDKTFTESISKLTGHTSNFSMGCSIEDINNDSNMDIMTLDMKPFDDSIYKKSGGWENLQIYNYKRNFGYHHQSPRNALQINQASDSNFAYFSEQACNLGVEASDWSWTPLIADFDNDGDKDIYITNGIEKRPNDLDFINFEFDGKSENKFDQILNIPKGKVSNIYFENNGLKGKFSKIFANENTASTSAAYADLNLDGKIDIVINNINEKASIFENIASNNHYLRIKLNGLESNINAIGTIVKLYSANTIQTATINSSNGFLSHNEGLIHFGLNANPDSIVVIWPNRNSQIVTSVPLDTLIEIDQKVNSKLPLPYQRNFSSSKKILKKYKNNPITFNAHVENKWLLFNENSSSDQLYTYQDSLCVVSRSGTIKGYIESNTFIESNEKKSIFPVSILKLLEKQDIKLFSVADQNLDGNLDYFIQTILGNYVFISNLENYRKLELPFEKDLKSVAWGDINGNKNLELVYAGLWMPINIVNFEDPNYNISSLPNSKGWWFSISISDIDNNGKKDIIAGNFGTNHSLKADELNPIQAYENDFDKNGSIEKLITYFDKNKEVPYPNQQLFVDQLPYAKKKFLKNKDYVKASIQDLLGTQKIESSKLFSITELRSCYYLNNEKWTKKILPNSLQLSPIFQIEKINNQEFYFGGNLFDVDPNLGRQDAISVSNQKFLNGKWINQKQNIDLIQSRGEIRSIKFFQNKVYFIDSSNGLFMIDPSFN